VSGNRVRAAEALTEARRGLRAWSPYDGNVFINCPFDAGYRPLLNAIVFAIQDCGLFARCAMEVQDSGEVRITKIKRIIRQCRHGIHDISRVELDAATGLPRFNMPLELGNVHRRAGVRHAGPTTEALPDPG